MAKEKFVIEPHFRLHEWVAEEKGYFKDEGLEYEFRELVQSSDGASQQLGDKVGASTVRLRESGDPEQRVEQAAPGFPRARERTEFAADALERF